MDKELPVRVVQDPSRGFTDLPDQVTREPDLTLCLDIVSEDRIRARLFGNAVPALHGTVHRADLRVSVAEVRAAAARVSRLWKELLVDFRPLAEDGRPVPGEPERPYASLVDLRGRPPGELYAIVDQLALTGSELLFDTLLGGTDPRVELFGSYLAEALAAYQGLRVRFDSELYLPWPMVCLRPEDVPVPADAHDAAGLFPRFLGHRHQIEQTGGAYPWMGGLRDAPVVPSVSLNHDVRVDRKGRTRAAEVAELLAKDTHFAERTTRAALLDALARRELCEHLMYFWCHGQFIPNGSQPACLAVKLTDETAIDARAVRERRRRFGDSSPFQPFVLLNACHAGVPDGGGDLAYLGGELIKAGARGVLGPQTEIPQRFAAEYALEFLTRYLHGEQTAGAIAHQVARHFADELHNPLGFAYTLHYGMDTRLERAVAPAAGSGQEVAI